MTPTFFLQRALIPALSLLPPEMDTPPARAMVIAPCLQESGLTARRQRGGPARGYAQFEKGGIDGVLKHPASGPLIRAVLASLDYDPATTADMCYAAIEHNDILMAAFARCLVWTLPQALPGPNSAQDGWIQYVQAWRPGKPRRASWDSAYAQAWAVSSGVLPPGWDRNG